LKEVCYDLRNPGRLTRLIKTWSRLRQFIKRNSHLLTGAQTMFRTSSVKIRFFFTFVTLICFSTFQFIGNGTQTVSANNTPQTLPFSQDWSTNLLSTTDDWSPVPGIVGFRGDDLTTATGVDPRTLLQDGSATPVDVNVNQANPDTFATGGVAEFDTLTNPVVALQGSGTADAPFLVLYLNTTGQSNIRVQYNARDVDGSADNAVQPIVTQYRVGSTGSYVNVAGGFIADATTGPSLATLVTPVNAVLPAAANNQPLVEVRIMTTNAVGNDEWVGIDDISVTTSATAAPDRAGLDFNGDGRTDYALTRDAAGLRTWNILYSGTQSFSSARWGLNTDNNTPSDYDGDGITDLSVWRSGPPTQAFFYIFQSATNTVRIESFGQNGDSPKVVRDYDGDGKADPAVYRDGASAGAQSFFFFRGSLNNPSGAITYMPWGVNGDVPTSGDFDGDGKGDFAVRRNVGGNGMFIIAKSGGGIDFINFGLPTDAITPADFDGDGKTDLTAARPNGSVGNFFWLNSSNGAITGPLIGANPDTDFLAVGDYDGDGRADVAVWRETDGNFYVRNTVTGIWSVQPWGMLGDEPLGEWNVTGGN
jgi:hypothetical protein